MISSISEITKRNIICLLNILIKKKIKLYAAESFTGGLFAEMITSIPGSSKSFELCLVTYSNLSKKILLDIPDDILSTYGAVSNEVATSMSLNILKKYSLNRNCVSVSCTGVAGPDGGSQSKPVGTAFFSFTYKDKNKTIKKEFSDSGRELIRAKAIDFMVKTLIDVIK